MKAGKLEDENNGAALQCCKLPDRAQSFVFCSKIVTEFINAMFLLVSKLKMIGMLLNVVHGQVRSKKLS